MAHSLFLLLFILVAAPLAGYIPLAALAAVLALVAWDMVEKPAFATLLRASWGDATVLLVTLGLTLFRDLSDGDRRRLRPRRRALHPPDGAVGLGRGAPARPLPRGGRRPAGRGLPRHRRDVLRRRLRRRRRPRPHRRRPPPPRRRPLGRHPGRLLGREHDRDPRPQGRRRGVALYVAGAAAPLRRALLAHGARPPLVRYAPSIDAALAGARRRGVLEGPAPGAAEAEARP